MDALTLECCEKDGIDRNQEPVELGIPLACGQVRSCEAIELQNPDTGEVLTSQTRPLALWPDGSIRWFALSTQLDLKACTTQRLKLDWSSKPGTTKEPLFPEVSGTAITLDTGKLYLKLPRDSLEWSVGRNTDSRVTHRIRLQDEQGNLCTSHMDRPWEVIESGNVCTVFSCEGEWKPQNQDTLARFCCRLTAYRNSEEVRVEIALHNPQRTIHADGLWDLGDSGSVYFRALTLTASIANPQSTWLRPEAGISTLEQPGHTALYLYQDSSGGENWNSRNHIDANGKLTPRFRGYRIYGDTDRLASGLRAEPVAGMRGEGIQVSAALENFWQNFPSAIGYRDQELVVGLFPEDSAACHELQGGERKTQVAWFHYGNRQGALNRVFRPLRPTLPARTYEQAHAFPWFAATGEPTPLDCLIQDGLDPDRGFLAKREIIDEYGWRNFGDIFADHESLYLAPGEPPLISHYNNQYDSIYGFARQYARTGDPRWFSLMDELARHVADIDIYHTESDRDEYNGGLFWHTDHYLDAHTATHRTYSRHNSTSSIPGQTGGGPAAEHCYSTGLLYHYFLTGNPGSREAVLKLALWIRRSHEGRGGLLEQLLAFKKHELPALKALIKGTKTSSHTYPFTRGTGNYINTLLDASILEPGNDWLDQAETVIRNTIHPADDIEDRHLLDAETGWSYLVLLSALARYLVLKSENENFDAHYYYGLASFRHYTRWMLDNEHPFLDTPDQLEFANHTWVAQDIRKAMLMYQAAWFDPERKEVYRARASEWLDYVCQTLEASPERHFSRIQAILLQNHGPHQTSLALAPEATVDGPITELQLGDSGALTWGGLLRRITCRVWRGIRTFRPARELAWLTARLGVK